MASHEGVGHSQKSRFHLLHEHINVNKKEGETSNPHIDPLVVPDAVISVGSPRPPPHKENKRKNSSHKGTSSSRHPSPKRPCMEEDSTYT